MLHPIDIVDEHNQFTGEVSDPDDVNNRGLWHRGAHAILITPSGQLLLQRRSMTILYNPGRLDIGVGGYVDSGETPEQAIVREVFEETGLHILVSDLTFLHLWRHNHRWRFGNIKKVNRSFIYTYLVTLPDEQNVLHSQKEEVDWIGFISFRRAKWLARIGSTRFIKGRLPNRAYFRRTLRQTARFIWK